MLKSPVRSVIRLRGVRHNNLKNFDLDLPLNRLIVITGLSGSGKSSLAFDTLFAEGQRRYIETFSPYARQFFDRMDKPQVDSIEGIPPAIAIEQRNSVKTTRSTVGTMTEICDYMKTLWSHFARLYCRQCGQLVTKDSPQQIWQSLRAAADPKGEVLITFDLPLSEKLSLEESLALVSKQGYQRLLVDGRIVNLGEADADPALAALSQRGAITSLTVVQDRARLSDASRSRFIEGCEQAYHFGKGKLSIRAFEPGNPKGGPVRRFSNRLHCARCDIEYRDPSAALFSFNHPVGACPTCKGFGRVINIDYGLVMPNRSKTIAQVVVKPWQTGLGAECQDDLLRMCRKFGVPIDIPFNQLAKKWQSFVIDGEPGYGKDKDHQWPRAWYGVKGYFRWLESKSYKMHVRVLLSRYRAYTPCPDCQGNRFQPESLLYRADGANGATLTLADFYRLPIRDTLPFIDSLSARLQLKKNDPLSLVLGEVRSRLEYLNEVGLGYITLDRPTRSLSGGETERVNLTTCLGSRLVNTLFVLDEPSVGLHSRDTERLVHLLEQLRDAGNTVVVVEHEAEVMRAADQIVDLGPGHGATGGDVVFQGSYPEILKSGQSLTGQYLSGRKQGDVPKRRPVDASAKSDGAFLKLTHASRNNLKDVSVEIPLHRFVCVTGVSGSGKTTLVREVLLPALTERFQFVQSESKASDRMEAQEDNDDEKGEAGSSAATSTELTGTEFLSRVILVDQSILAKTPRSNPAVYIGAFDDLREVFAQTELAQQRGLNASAFSFNSQQGQCERCRGAGFEKIEMQFLSDIFIRCPECDGRRYRPHILEVKINPNVEAAAATPTANGRKSRLGANPKARIRNAASNVAALRSLSIADLLDSTVDEAIAFLSAFADSRPARRAAQSLTLIQEVGLGYLKLGQPINTLSGGESQRLKLVRHLTDSITGENGQGAGASQPTLFLFDEPTTGLHFDDVRVLLKVFQRLVDAGHSVVVIEHNVQVIQSSDWVIDLGPDAGDQGGEIVAAGTPEEVALNPRSHTGKALRGGFPDKPTASRPRKSTRNKILS